MSFLSESKTRYLIDEGEISIIAKLYMALSGVNAIVGIFFPALYVA